MPVIIGPGFAQIFYLLFDQNTQKVNTVSMGIDIDLTADTGQEILDALSDSFFARWNLGVDSAFIYQGARMLVGSDGPPSEVTSTSSAGAMTRNVVSAAAGANNCIISKKTAFVGRAFRGRVFMPGTVSEADVDEAGRLLSTRVTALQGAASNWLADFSDTVVTGLTNIQPAVLLHSPPATGGIAPSPSLITNLIVRPIYGIVRRRRPRA